MKISPHCTEKKKSSITELFSKQKLINGYLLKRTLQENLSFVQCDV